jgi:hypothetical protein
MLSTMNSYRKAELSVQTTTAAATKEHTTLSCDGPSSPMICADTPVTDSNAPTRAAACIIALYVRLPVSSFLSVGSSTLTLRVDEPFLVMFQMAVSRDSKSRDGGSWEQLFLRWVMISIRLDPQIMKTFRSSDVQKQKVAEASRTLAERAIHEYASQLEDQEG